MDLTCPENGDGPEKKTPKVEYFTSRLQSLTRTVRAPRPTLEKRVVSHCIDGVEDEVSSHAGFKIPPNTLRWDRYAT